MHVSLTKRLDTLETTLNKRKHTHISFDADKTYIQSYGDTRLYLPSDTGKQFHNDDSFVRLVIGPYGSGKSTMCCHEIVRRAIAMPKWYKGIRRSKWAVVRNTTGELQSTTLQTWLTWFEGLGEIKKKQKPILTYEHIFNDAEGIVELELLFIALDREQDVRKIKSLEVTGAYLNELCEIPQAALSHFKGRVNHRYPSNAFCDAPYWSGIIADTNPPDVDHWMYKDFEVKQLQNYKIFHQPPGLIKNIKDEWRWNEKADNANNLAKDYYLKLAEGQTEDFIKVFCLGEYGSVGFGKKVYPEYNDDIHSVARIAPIPNEPIHLFWDFGLTPACVVIQITPRGQLTVLKEYTSEDIGIRSFAQSIVLPNLSRDFPKNKIGYSDADPAGAIRDQIMDELSCIGELNNLGIATEAARTNDLEPRLGSVRYFLNTMVDGKPAFLLSREGCPTIRRGFTRDYCYKRISIGGEERYREIPTKNESSHPHDCLQYGAMRFAYDRIIKEKQPKVAIDLFNPVFRYL